MRLQGEQSIEFRMSLIVKLSEEGKTQKMIAALTQCDQSWVSKVLKRHKMLGAAGLRVKGKAPGKASKLSVGQIESLKVFLLEGALHHGFETDNWSRERIVAIIKRQFEQDYHVSHISKLMRKIGFSLQKPKSRSYRKDESSVEKWKTEQLPEIKKSS